MKKTLTLCLALLLLLSAAAATAGYADTPAADVSVNDAASAANESNDAADSTAPAAEGTNGTAGETAGISDPSEDGGAVAPMASAAETDANGTIYEAEAAGNTMTGNASVSNCDACSGGKKVGGLYQGSTLQMKGIEAAEAGSYYALIDYISGDPRSADISVNGAAAKHVEFKKTQDWSTLGTQTVMLELKAGTNVIEFADGNSYSPDIDRITIVPVSQSYEGEAAANELSGNASIYDCAACSDGKKIGNLYQGASVRVNGVNVPEAGAYEITVSYISGDPRAFNVSVNDGPAQNILFAKTADWDTVGTQKISVMLKAGDNSILFSDGGGYAPDLDKITVAPLAGQVVAGCERADADPVVPAGEPAATKSFGAITLKEYEHQVLVEQAAYAVLYDQQSGLAAYSWNGKTIAKGVYSKFGELASSCYSGHSFSMNDVKPVTDGFGSGIEVTFVSSEAGKPTLHQVYSFYANKPFFLTRTEAVGSGELAANYMAPVVTNTEGGIDIGSYGDGRVLSVPYDNDMWIRYQAVPINAADTSYEVTAVYDNTTRDGLILGSVTHDTWKTGIDFIGEANKLNSLAVYGGASSAKTHDSQPHGTVTGTELASPQIFVGYYDDYRTGLEAYGEANAVIAPPLAFGASVPSGVPVGWNSWGAFGSSLSYQDVIDTSNYYKQQLKDMDNDGVTYINLDSYWDNMTDQQLADAVAAIHANGQKAGIYWGPFVYWGNNMEQLVDGSSFKYGDILLRDQDGNLLPTLDGAYAVDPTHPGAKDRMNYFLGKFKNLGFEYIKLDFLTHGALEGVHHDPAVQTGTQAYNAGMAYIKGLVGDSMFISASIAPMFPSQYAHSRRIATDTFGSIGDTEYELNALTYGWWQNGTIYHYTDPDHMALTRANSLNEARSRVNSAVVSGTVFLGSDDVNDPKAQEYMQALYTNKAVLEVAKKGKAFRAIEGNTGSKAADSFVLNDNGTYYLALFNYSGDTASKSISLARAGLDDSKTYKVTELWSGGNSKVTGTLDVSLAAADSKLFKLTVQNGGGSNSSPNPGGTGGTVTVPEPPTGSGSAAPGDLSAAVTVQPAVNGQAAAQVSTTEALALMKKAANGLTTFTVSLPKLEDTTGVTISLDRDFVTQAIELAGKETILHFDSQFGPYSIPLAKLQSAEGSGVQISIGYPDAAAQTAIKDSLPAGYALHHSVAFHIGVTGAAGEAANLNAFGNYMAQSFAVDDSVDPRTVSIVRLNESGGLSPLPAVLRKLADGSYEAVAQTVSNGSYAVVTGSRSFTDTSGHWAKESIDKLAASLVINGKTASEFAPGEEVTRAEFASLLVRALGLSGGQPVAASFTDVAPQSWFAADVNTAASLGLVTGSSNGSFQPNAAITRQEMAVMLSRALAFANPAASGGEANPANLNGFADAASVASWAKQAVQTIVQAGLMKGNEAGELRPQDYASRAETAVLLDRLLISLGFTGTVE